MMLPVSFFDVLRWLHLLTIIQSNRLAPELGHIAGANWSNDGSTDGRRSPISKFSRPVVLYICTGGHNRTTNE